MTDFPIWYYHPTEGRRLVHDQEEADGLGPHWEVDPQHEGNAAQPAFSGTRSARAEARQEARDFPSWRYHHTDAPRLIKSREEAETLDEDWSDTPYPGRPTTPGGSPLEAAAHNVAMRYWTTGKASKFELYVIGVALGLAVTEDMSAEELRAVVETRRP